MAASRTSHFGRVRSAGITWEPPQGWTQTQAGVWTPPDYQPTRWEIGAPEIRTVEEAELDWIKCSKSLPYFAFRHCWTIDVDDPTGVNPRKVPAYPYLRRFFTEVQTPTNVHVEKSRQMLLSWAWMVVFLWDVLFHKNWTALVLSKRSKDVDDGGANATIGSNFGKLKYIQEHLAEHLWIPFEYKKFMIRVPSTRSSITGETGKGGMAARGPTYKRALMDEAAHIEHSEAVFSGLRQAAKTGTALNSTPFGKGNTFERIRFSKTSSFKKLSFHWSEHPRKAIGLYCLCGWKAIAGSGKTPPDQFREHAPHCPRLAQHKTPEMRSPWYDTEAGDLTPDKVASELDISYEGSRAGRVYTAFSQAVSVLEVIDRLGPRGYDESPEDYRMRYLRSIIDPRYPLVTSKDIGVGDATSMHLAQIIDDETPFVRFIDEYEDSDKSYDFYGTIINTVWKVAAQQAGNRIAFRHYGGYDVRNRDSKLESWFTNLKGMGIHVETASPKDRSSLLEWVDFINFFGFAKGNIQITDWCTHTIDALANYHYPTDENGNPIPGKHNPVHDEWSHSMDAMRYLFKIRYAAKLLNRERKGVPMKRVLARGGGYDPKTERRIF
jgi:hypothetical protein